MMVLFPINILLGKYEWVKFFGQHRICERRKLRNIASALTNDALAWWKHLFES
jgi:hypothetical protein